MPSSLSNDRSPIAIEKCNFMRRESVPGNRRKVTRTSPSSDETREATPTTSGGTREVTRRALVVGTGDGAESTGWLAERGNPRRSAPRWTRPTRKKTLSCESGRGSYVCWRRRARTSPSLRARQLPLPFLSPCALISRPRTRGSSGACLPSCGRRSSTRTCTRTTCPPWR